MFDVKSFHRSDQTEADMTAAVNGYVSYKLSVPPPTCETVSLNKKETKKRRSDYVLGSM